MIDGIQTSEQIAKYPEREREKAQRRRCLTLSLYWYLCCLVLLCERTSGFEILKGLAPPTVIFFIGRSSVHSLKFKR